MGRRHRQGGFSLVEVMCALLVFTVAAVVLGSSYVNVLNSYFAMGRASRSQDDVAFARAALLTETDIDKAREGGDYTRADGRRVQWSAEIEPTTIPDLFTVTFRCEVDDPEQPRPIISEQVFRLLRPTWSDPAERGKLREQTKQRIFEMNQRRNL